MKLRFRTAIGLAAAASLLTFLRCTTREPAECNGECTKRGQTYCGAVEFSTNPASISCEADQYGCFYERTTGCDAGTCNPTTGLCGGDTTCGAATTCDACVTAGCGWCGSACLTHAELQAQLATGSCTIGPASDTATCAAIAACAPCNGFKGADCTSSLPNECECRSSTAQKPANAACVTTDGGIFASRVCCP